tara:strand:- start:171 stop:635 length:465 start_codon:yes stop_codon:yes gene_type:complete
MSTIKVDTLQTRAGSTAAVTGAGFVATDQIRGNTSAGSTTVVAEGGSTTTNLQQGLAKVFTNINMSGSIRDSLNLTSITDNGTGDFTQTIANDMADGNYTHQFTQFENGRTGGYLLSNYDSYVTASIFRGRARESGGSLNDSDYVGLTIHGDLA